jgi:hypothetical protein
VKRRTWAIVGLTAVAVAVVGGYLLRGGGSSGGWPGRAREDRPFVPPDPWYRLVSDEFIGAADARERDPSTFAVVVPARAAEALARLERAACVEVPEQEAEQLAGRRLGGAGGRLVLLRGLAWDTPYGGFTVSWRPGAVRVNHGCLGTHPPPVVRRAVVARLPGLPAEVFVDLCMAE